MSLVFHWFLPTSGDGRAIVGRGHSVPLIGSSAGPGGTRTGAWSAARPPDIDYLAQIARAAEQLGFTGVLTPTGTWCEDAWLVDRRADPGDRAAEVPGRLPARASSSPTLAAQMAATYQRISGGRLLLNVVTGGERDRAAPVRRPPAARRALRADRRVPGHRARRLERARRTTSTASYYQVSGRHRDEPAGPDAAGLLRRLLAGRRAGRGPARRRLPDLGRAAGRRWRQKIAWMRTLAAEAGRTLRFGIRLHVITRDTAEGGVERGRPGCWTASTRPTSRPRQQAPGPARVGRPAAGCARCTPATGPAAASAELEIYPNLWAGVGLVRGGAGTALVGSHERGRRPDRGVRRAGHRGVHLLRLPAPGGGVLVRRGRAARAAPPGRRRGRSASAGRGRQRSGAGGRAPPGPRARSLVTLHRWPGGCSVIAQFRRAPRRLD